MTSPRASGVRQRSPAAPPAATRRRPSSDDADFRTPFANHDFSFSASGWLMIYELGVAKALQMQGAHRDPTVRFVGASGGAPACAALALDLDVDFIKSFMIKCCRHCRRNPLKNLARLREYVLACVNKMLASDDQVRALGDRVRVSVTILPSCYNVLMTEFETRDEFTEALIASCTMSPLAGFPFPLQHARDADLRGRWVFDGGLTAMQPAIDPARTVAVSPFFCFAADIKPVAEPKHVPLWWALYPPSASELEDLYWRGFTDCNNYLESRGWMRASPSPAYPLMDERVARRRASMLSSGLPRSTSQAALAEPAPEPVPRARSKSARAHRHRISTVSLVYATLRSFYVFDFLFVLGCALFIKPIAYVVLLCEMVVYAAYYAARTVAAAFEMKRRGSVAPAEPAAESAPKSRTWSLRHWFRVLFNLPAFQDQYGGDRTLEAEISHSWRDARAYADAALKHRKFADRSILEQHSFLYRLLGPLYDAIVAKPQLK